MKKRNFWREVTAVLLSAALAAEMTCGGVRTAYAQEETEIINARMQDAEMQETVSGNAAGLIGEAAESELTETLSAEAFADAAALSASDGTTGDSSAASRSAAGSETWTDGKQIASKTINGGTESEPVVITVSGTVQVSETITISSGYVKFTGGGSLQWASGPRNAIVVAEGANVVFENITLDGNDKSFTYSALLIQGTAAFHTDTTVKNFTSNGRSGSGAGYKGVIAVYGKGVLNLYDGAVIMGNNSKSGGTISIYQYDDGNYTNPSTATVNMYGGTIQGNTLNSTNANMGVIWNWCGNLNISGGAVTAEGNEYAVHTQGNKDYNAATTISGGTFTGSKIGAVCAGKDSGNKSDITITGGIFTGKVAATVNYGTINISGGIYNGTDYALSNLGSGTLTVQGGEFLGGSKAYSGEIVTQTDKVVVGESKDVAANWDKQTSLNGYRYVMIGEIDGDGKNQDTGGAAPAEQHIHAVSVDCSQSSGTQEAFSVLGSGGKLSESGVLSGSYYLDADMDLEKRIVIRNGETVNLCLNGHKLTYTGSEENAIAVEQGGTLNLCDCNGSNGSHTFESPATEESVTLAGGMITRSSKVDAVGSGIRVYGIMNMYGGFVAGISDTGKEQGISNSHGAVRVDGTFHMYSGAITHNRSGCGGGVNVCSSAASDALFYLHDGSVSYNYADFDDGGGICLNNRCRFEMAGGEIIGNRAKSGGGGIQCYGPGDSADYVRLTGGIIAENTTGGETGGGIKTRDDSDCDVNRQLSIGGNARITGNTNKNGAENNLYLGIGKTIQVQNGFHGTVGVTTESLPTEGAPINITGTNTGDYSENFKSDNAAYKIVNNNNVLQLALPDTTPPTGAVKIDTDSWTSFLHTITFGVFFGETKTVTIEAADEASGVDKVFYYISDGGLSEAEIKALEESKWIEGSSFTISPDRKYVIYAKITDKEGNAAYLSSDGLVLDATDPEISGIADGETYRTPPTVRVTDENLKSVKVDDREVSLTDNQFILEAAEGQQTVAATDEAGNTAAVTVTVKTEAENVADAREIVQEVLAGITASNETIKQDIQNAIDAALREAGLDNEEISDMTVTVEGFTKTEATGSAVGSIRGSVSIQCGSETDSVEINKPIAKLPQTETDKVEAAKAVVEEAVAKITATNGSTKQDIQNAVDEALSKAGIAGVTAAVEGFTKTEATSSAAGSIRGSVSIQCGSETDSVEINKPIAKLPQTEAGKVDMDVQEGIKAPVTQITTSAEELQGMLLTEEENRQVQSGTNIRIVLEVQDAENTVSDGDKAEIEKALNSYEVGQYLNIDLYKIVGETRTDITETAQNIKIIITVPDSLKNGDSSNTRSFAVIRVHNGQAEVLADLDSAPDSITIETNRFSTYAVVYKDAADSGNNDNNSGNDSSDSDQGNDSNGDKDSSGDNDSSGDKDSSGDNDSGSSNDSDNSNNSNTNNDNDDDNDDGSNDSNSGSIGNPNKKDDEPKTGYSTSLELCATLAMITGFAYLLLYFSDRRRGMTEETKKELVSMLAAWGRRGGKLRKYLALAAIFLLLVYYHGIGKKSSALCSVIAE
ncbi:MAG: hypothetical protein NC094_04855 [Bacteroidales bacterium]|nr:hypothetical protein [Lachnoclostridium sp.]MCM1384229.1 hypothetical protein [Lachnoclostridium sp.]MCM1464729.1 hypothetical protein [Bacteroidales bacterium]